MEIFTHIEFKVEDFDKIENVISKLTSEGWTCYHNHNFHLMVKNEKKLVAKEYKFVRYI